jgi:hypothetical protein
MSIQISQEYKEQLKQIHSGTGKKMGWGLEPPVKLVETINKYKPKTILDYGCGGGAMMEHMQGLYPNTQLSGYDPGMAEFSAYPTSVDLIYSTDVFEHIEPAHIDSTLKLLWQTSPINFHKIACFPAKKKLPDGRNAHLIIEEPEWWINKIQSSLDKGFKILYNNTIIEYKKKREHKQLEVLIVKE